VNQWLKRDKSVDCIGFGLMVALSLFLGWLLSLAYPQGIITIETQGYWWVADRFRWFSANKWDWIHTIPYGLVLTICSKFKNPTNAIYWLNTGLFSLNIGLVYLLGRALYMKRLAGFGLSLCLLLFEFFSMRIFFVHLHATADPFVGELVFMGVLLALLGWLWCLPLPFIAAYAIFGLAAFTKPACMSLFPVWIIFAALTWLSQPGRLSHKCATILLSVFLLVFPVVFWTARNYFIYGFLKLQESGSFFLKAALPFLDEKDQVFPDKRRNAEFIAAVNESTQRNMSSQDFKGTPGCFIRLHNYEQYFFTGTGVTGPFDFLAGLKQPSQEARWNMAYSQSPRMYAIDAEAGRIAFCIIKTHPLPYLGRVLQEYTFMFSPKELVPNLSETYQSDPDIAYETHVTWRVCKDGRLYPGRSRPDANLSNRDWAKALGGFCGRSAMQSFLGFYYANQLAISHLIFAGALVTFIRARLNSSKTPSLTEAEKVAIVLIMLFLTTAFNYAVVGLCEVARFRYGLIGDLELHLLLLIALFTAIGALLKAGRSWFEKSASGAQRSEDN
jgi:hypothetical protein